MPDSVDKLSELTGIPRGEMLELWAQVKVNQAQLNSCAWHEFEQSPRTAMMRSVTHQKYVCRHCCGVIDHHAWYWHEQGRRSRP